MTTLPRAGIIKNDEGQDELLYLADLIHDVGKHLSYENHQIHSWYLIKNSSLMGFDEDEIDFMAYLALNHRRKKSKMAGLTPYMMTAPVSTIDNG